jgi:hypothetical protein
MSTLTAPEPTTTGTNNDPDVVHCVHDCNTARAFCGWDVSNEPLVDTWDDSDVCVVCFEICKAAGLICPRCEEPWW